MPTLPQNVSDAIGANGRSVIIKKNVFIKNKKAHGELTPEQGKEILKSVLYNANLYGQNQKESRPYNWILVHLGSPNHEAIIVEVSPTKEHLEVINWHYLRPESLEQKKRQAAKEGGLILNLPEGKSTGNVVVGNLSSEGKVSETLPDKQGNGQKSSAPKEVEKGEGYAIVSKPYTNKQGKTLDTYLVMFDRDFSREEMSALRAKVKEVKGWYDRDAKGWMLRSAEEAKAFADEVMSKSEDEVADEAPLSIKENVIDDSIQQYKKGDKVTYNGKPAKIIIINKAGAMMIELDNATRQRIKLSAIDAQQYLKNKLLHVALRCNALQ